MYDVSHSTGVAKVEVYRIFHAVSVRAQAELEAPGIHAWEAGRRLCKMVFVLQGSQE